MIGFTKNINLSLNETNDAKDILKYAKDFCDGIAMILKLNGLWEKGFKLRCTINPEAKVLNEDIEFFGGLHEIELYKKDGETSFYILEPCSTEPLTSILTGEKDGTRADEGNIDENAVPSDSDPICSDPDGNPVDGGQ